MDDETRKDIDENSRRALEEAGHFMLEHNGFSDDREVRCITPFADDKPQLTLGNLRVLIDLASAGAAMMLLQDHQAASGGQPEAGDPVRAQARRYMEAVYGESVWFRAPETFGNVLERWIWAVGTGEPELAEEAMGRIETMAKQQEQT
jgi:hypothetical protein